LKGILVKAPVLKLPDFDKDFEIHSDASDFAIGGVLVQEGRPVAFESKKLSETERRWPTHEKEMWAVIDTLPSPGVNPLEGSPKCSCGKLGLGRRSLLPAL
jgi:hypothetical protein